MFDFAKQFMSCFKSSGFFMSFFNLAFVMAFLLVFQISDGLSQL